MRRLPGRTRSRLTLAIALAASPIAGCGDSPIDPGREPPAVDLDALFAGATPGEIAAVRAEWAARSTGAAGVVFEGSSLLPFVGGFRDVRVYSHIVDGNRHLGALIGPAAAPAGSLPILVFTHPGDVGVTTADVAVVLALFGDRADDYLFAIPAFRSEALTAGTVRFQSEGEPSPWDRDVDDALAFLDVAIQVAPEADPERIAVLGYSRGGGVALLMAVRDPRVDAVVDFAGPTDFFDSYVREIVADALKGTPANLPGFITLDTRFISPLAAGTITPADFRRELVRRSPVLFAEFLPPTQIHHGTADEVVAVSQAESLIAALDALDRPAGMDEGFLYPGAGHNPLELIGAPQRTLSFLDRHLDD